MSLSASLSIAASGLANVNREIALVSQNVANASTPGYAVESAESESLTAGGEPMGVTPGLATVNLNRTLEASVLQQNATVAGLGVTTNALSVIDAVMGKPGSGSDLASLVGALQDAFSVLGDDPSDATGQQAVVQAAGQLASAINTLSTAYTTGREDAEQAIVSTVGTINQTLASIGKVSQQIITAKSENLGIADLENQRSAMMQTLSGLLDVQFLPQNNGGMLVVTRGGLELPTNGGGPLAVAPATLGANATYPGSIPPITLGGEDVTNALTGGSLGANITLRDQTSPGYQAGLDEFAHTLATRFANQGLTLFSDPSGAVPSGGTPAQVGYVGFASEIQVNPAVTANPALVRDGTNAIAGSPTGAAAFTPNPPGGPAGFETLIMNVLNYAFGTEVQAGVAQPPPNTTGLGPLGTLSLPFAAPGTPGAFAADLLAEEAAASRAASSAASSEQAVESALASQLSASAGVDMDAQMAQMVALQNSYGANARVLSAVQSMWNDLMNAVPG